MKKDDRIVLIASSVAYILVLVYIKMAEKGDIISFIVFSIPWILYFTYVKIRQLKIAAKEARGDYRNKKIIYSPPLYLIMGIAWGLPISISVIGIIEDIRSTGKIYNSTFWFIKLIFIMCLPWVLFFLAYGKKICLGDDSLIIKRLLPFLKTRKIKYEDIASLGAGTENTVGWRGLPIGLGIAYLNLMNGKTLRLDFPDEGGVKDSFEQLIENVNKFKK